MIWKRRRWLLACGVLAAWAAALCLLLTGRKYHAEATLEFQSTTTALADAAWLEVLGTERAILLSRAIQGKARTLLSGQPGGEELQVERVPSARILRVRASSDDAKRATQLVEAVVQLYLERQAEQQRQDNPALSLTFSELDAEGQALESEAEAYAAERGLLVFDADLERSELGMLRGELTRGRMQDIRLEAELKQLERALQAKSYRVSRFAANPELRDALARLASLEPGARPGGSADDSAARAELTARIDALARDTVATLRAELELLRDQQKKLSDFLAFQEDRLARRETELAELKRRRRLATERQALRDALLRAPRPQPAFAVRVLDPAHPLGASPSTSAWSRSALLFFLGIAALSWGVRGHLDSLRE